MEKDQAFMVAVRLTELDYLEELLKKYIGEQPYLICGEIAEGSHKETDGEHCHIWANTTDTIYHKYTKVIKTKYKLRGRATAGKPRQYGKLNNIKSLEQLKIYMLKDQDEKNSMVRTNMEPKNIETLKAKSFKKCENQEKWDNLLTIAHDLIKEKINENGQEIYDQYQTEYKQDSPIQFFYENDKYQKSDSLERLDKKSQIEWLSKVNQKHREIYNGLPMTKNTMLKLRFKFEQLSDYEYMENLMRYI